MWWALEYLVSSWRRYFGSLGGVTVLQEVWSLRVGFEASKPDTVPSLLFLLPV